MLTAYDIALAFVLGLLAQLQKCIVLHALLVAIIVFAWILILGTIVVFCWEPGRSLGGVIDETQFPPHEVSGDDFADISSAPKEIVLVRDCCSSDHIAFKEDGGRWHGLPYVGGLGTADIVTGPPSGK